MRTVNRALTPVWRATGYAARGLRTWTWAWLLPLAACSTPAASSSAAAADGAASAAGDGTVGARFGDVGGGGDATAGATDAADALLDGGADTSDGIDTDAPSEVADAGTGDAAADAPKPFQYECKPLTVESCVTACGSAGQRKCLKEWGPCVPPDEFCGNCADDDCDGSVNEGCAANPACAPPTSTCAMAQISIVEGNSVAVGTTLHLAAVATNASSKAIAGWTWSVQAPAGASAAFVPSDTVNAPTLTLDVAGIWLLQLQVQDADGKPGCGKAVATVHAAPSPPVEPSAGCADGTREGFADQAQWPQIAGCSGAWEQPGITPDSVAPTCGRQGGNSGSKPDGKGCSSADLCAVGWHVCKGWQEVAQRSTTGCAGAAPADAKPKSLFFAMRQPSADGSVCGAWGDGVNDVFGCGNLGTSLAPEKKCGPLDRVLASTKPNACGFNEAEPSLGPWQCLGPGSSDLQEGANVTKKACQAQSCQYDGVPLGPSDKGGVLCCHD